MSMNFYICCRRACPRRSLDSATIHRYLELNGWTSTRRVEDADLLIVYTCGGFETTEERSLCTIRQITDRKKDSAALIVTGCLVKINPNVIKGLGNYNVLEPEQLSRLDEIVQADMPYKNVPDANIIPEIHDLAFADSHQSPLKKFFTEFEFSRFFAKRSVKHMQRKLRGWTKTGDAFATDVFNLKIAQGCLGKCTYCAIRMATGRLNSRPLENILEQFEDGLSNGYKRFVLIAEDTGCYGLDIGTNVVSLLEKMFQYERDFSLIIKDFNPNWFVKYYNDLKPLIVQNVHKIEDIRMPIQSGSDRILRLMKRPYRIADVKRPICDLKARVPHLKIHTHLLVGFPGETDLDFEQSRELLQQMDFAEVAVYCYEERSVTKASLLPNKVPVEVKRKRALTLEASVPSKLWG